MTVQPVCTVRQVSVVLASPYPIDPQSITPEALSNNRVVPLGWVTINSTNTQESAFTQYQNYITIQVKDNYCTIQEPIGAIGGVIPETYEIHSIAQRYAENNNPGLYNAVGINWLLDITVENPIIWMREKTVGFGGQLAGFFPTSVQMAQTLDDAVCYLTFRIDNSRVAIDFNYHFQLADASVAWALNQWNLCQEHLIEDVLRKIGLL